MATRARDIMTAEPVRCTSNTSVDEVARLMVQENCGEIPIVDRDDHLVGVVTDRDIVRRVVAESKNPVGYTVDACMSQPVVTVSEDAPIEDVVATMERHQIRRVPVVDDSGCCAGIISQADIARRGPEHEVAELVREVSRETGRESRVR